MILGTSPSGAHTEPWTFVVVKDQGMKCKNYYIEIMVFKKHLQAIADGHSYALLCKTK